MQIIYCYDEKSKDKLVKDGFKLLNHQIIDNRPCWLFENNNHLNFERKVDNKLVYF